MENLLNDGERAVLYGSLARMFDAGVPPETLYSMLHKSFRSARVRAVIAACAEAVRHGQPLSAALSACAPSIPPYHALAVAAAEQSGTVPETLRELAAGDEERVRARRRLLGSAAYPVLLVHLAVVAPNGGLLVTDFGAFLLRVVPILVTIDVALFFAWRVVARPPRGSGSFLLRVPIVGELTRAANYRPFFRALGALYDAGVPIHRAATEATAAIATPALREEVEAALAPVLRHEPMADCWPGFPGLRDDVRAVLVSSEPAGELSSALGRVARTYAEAEELLRARVVRLAAGTVYFASILYVAARVLIFYDDYFGRLGSF